MSNHQNSHSNDILTQVRINQLAGCLVLGAGLQGARRAASRRFASVTAGLGLGGLFFLSSYWIHCAQQSQSQQLQLQSQTQTQTQKSQQRLLVQQQQQGHWMASATGALGFATMAHWFVQSGRIVPSGAIALVCSLAFGYNNFQAIRLESSPSWSEKSRDR